MVDIVTIGVTLHGVIEAYRSRWRKAVLFWTDRWMARCLSCLIIIGLGSVAGKLNLTRIASCSEF